MFSVPAQIDKTCQILSFNRLDQAYADTLAASSPGHIWQGIKKNFSSFPKASFLAHAQTLSFILVCILMLSLGAPQFANDKEGLALIVLFGLVLRLVSLAFSGKEPYAPSAPDALILGFLSLNVIATFASHYFLPSVHGLAKVVVYTLSYFLFTGALGSDRQKATKRTIIILSSALAAAFFVALYGLYQYKIGVAPLATWEDPSVENQGTRIYSTLGNPNLLAAYLLPLVPVGFSLSMISARKRNWLGFIFAFAGFFLTLSATILTGSRGGFLGLFAAVAVYLGIASLWFWQEKPKARIFVVATFLLVVAALGALFTLVPSFHDRLASIFAGREHTSNSFRLNVWGSSWKMFLDNWWIGIGPGNQTFRLAYGLYMVSGFDALGTYCVPLEIAVETGIFGLLIFAFLLVSLSCRAHLSFWSEKESTRRWLIIAAMAGICGLMVQGLVDTVFFRPQVHLIFWLLLSILTALTRTQSRQA